MIDDSATTALDKALAVFPAGTREFLVGFSGGLDSGALLHRMAGTPLIRLRAMHVHHGLHPDADRWVRHCRQFCDALGVEMEVVRVQVTHDAGEGIEAAARHARYAAFAAALREGECLVTAHHQDDQAETVLLRLLRGSGAGGLGAMRALRPFANGLHWRPLLVTPRAVLVDYAQAHGLSWIDDPSNASELHDRNFLRHRVMPVLHERWPQAGAALARSAILLSEHASLLDEETARRLAQVQGVDPGTVSVISLQQFSAPWRALIVRQWIASLDLPTLPSTGVDKIELELLPARADASAEFRWHGAVIHRWRDLLYAEKVAVDLPPNWRVAWDGAAPLQLPTGMQLAQAPVGAASAANIASLAPFHVTSRRGGERIALPGRSHSHALKNILQEFGIPPWERQRLPLVFAADGELLAVGDLLRSARAQAAGCGFRLEMPPK